MPPGPPPWLSPRLTSWRSRRTNSVRTGKCLCPTGEEGCRLCSPGDGERKVVAAAAAAAVVGRSERETSFGISAMARSHWQETSRMIRKKPANCPLPPTSQDTRRKHAFPVFPRLRFLSLFTERSLQTTLASSSPCRIRRQKCCQRQLVNRYCAVMLSACASGNLSLGMAVGVWW